MSVLERTMGRLRRKGLFSQVMITIILWEILHTVVLGAIGFVLWRWLFST